jgi:hypothetical protein
MVNIDEYINENSVSSGEENELHITLIIGANFQTWEEFESHLERYALQEGFPIKKQELSIQDELELLSDSNDFFYKSYKS